MEYLGSGYIQRLLDYLTFDVRLLKRCFQKTASTVFGTLDPFSTEFIVTFLKGAEHCYWMQFRQYLPRENETGDLSFLGLVDVVSNIIGVWPFMVSYLKETGRKDSCDSSVVCLFLVVSILSWLPLLISVSMLEKKEIDGYFYIEHLSRMKFRLFHLISQMCRYLHQLS